MCRKFL